MKINKNLIIVIIRRKLIKWKLIKTSPQDIADEVFIQKIKKVNNEINKKNATMNQKIEKSIENLINLLIKK